MTPGGIALFLVALVLAVIAAVLGAVWWFAKEAAALVASWFLNWDRHPPSERES